jgi:hypothetical protein
MARARRAATVDLPPREAFALWTDATRWATFVDGFGHVEQVGDDWPHQGAKLVWRSVPTGRGTVTEKVQEAAPGRRLVTRVTEERLTATQTVEFEPAHDDPDATAVTLEFDYRLNRRDPFTLLTDVIFIRRAQADALDRTLRRFAIEAAEEAAL